jgi:hypothetical protein
LLASLSLSLRFIRFPRPLHHQLFFIGNTHGVGRLAVELTHELGPP